MSTPIRKEVLSVIDELSTVYPDWRIGQLVANIATLAKGPTVESIWDVEDEEFLAAAKSHLEKRTGLVREAG